MVRLFRDRMDLSIENEEITFSRQYFVPNNGNWIIDYENVSVTNESGTINSIEHLMAKIAPMCLVLEFGELLDICMFRFF